LLESALIPPTGLARSKAIAEWTVWMIRFGGATIVTSLCLAGAAALRVGQR
jgi:hypothetical protein